MSISAGLFGWFGRGGGIRTPTRGFGDRWSAVKPTPLSNSSVLCRGRARPAYGSGMPGVRVGHARPLLDFFVRMVLAAEWAVLFKLQPLRHGLLVLHAGVVLPLALGALQCDLFPRHVRYPFITR